MYIKLLAVFLNFVTASLQNITVPIYQRRSRSFLPRDRLSFPNVSGQLCISMRRAGHEVFCLVTAFVTALLCTVVSFTCVSVYRQAGHEVFCLVTAKAPFFLTKFFSVNYPEQPNVNWYTDKRLNNTVPIFSC